ncbi:dTDP-4-dehydrorhamnose 3,5-epimerase family protein [Luteolibacter sp. AS25]|uniref:dTDP-4-dehydrorhamnose 3,5-epimerase family protein n=1 Tax=Luteolibacter sp. AS25 TaxID=3135776 RepID=UPI00398B8EA2
MITKATTLHGVTLLSPPRFNDARGSFRPLFAQRLHSASGYSHPWAEMNLSHTEPGTIRGLHFQDPGSQAKLITVVSGTIFDVAVDLRPHSPTFLKFETFTLSAENPDLPSQIYLPEGLAHGLATPYGSATIAYLVSSPWSPDTEKVLAWNDPALNIAWPITNPNLSRRDQSGLPISSLITS